MLDKRLRPTVQVRPLPRFFFSFRCLCIGVLGVGALLCAQLAALSLQVGGGPAGSGGREGRQGAGVGWALRPAAAAAAPRCALVMALAGAAPHGPAQRAAPQLYGPPCSALARQAIERAEKAGLAGGGLERADSTASSASGLLAARGAPAAAAAAEAAAAPATPSAEAIYRQRPRRRAWADLADEVPPVVRLPVWPESLEAAAAAARADPAAAVAAILAAATPEGSDPVSSLRCVGHGGGRARCCVPACTHAPHGAWASTHLRRSPTKLLQT